MLPVFSNLFPVGYNMNSMSKSILRLKIAAPGDLAEEDAKVSAACRRDSQMLAHLSEMPLSW